jgi:transcriptional regulator with GAF, ATPase, and Fis domain
VLSLDSAALYLRDPSGTMRLASAEGDVDGSPSASAEFAGVVAEPEERYGGFDAWLPIVVENADLGRVALARASNGERLGDGDLAVAALLCGGLGLALRNAEHRSRRAALEREIDELRRTIERERTTIRNEVRRLESFPEIIGQSEALRRALGLVERMAPSDVSILITGETGTGKELVARAIHGHSTRREGRRRHDLP